MMGNWGFGSGAFLGFGGLVMLIFWVLVIWVVVALVRSGGSCCGRHIDQTDKKEDSRPMDILKERYAKGEISKDEFEKMKKDLM